MVAVINFSWRELRDNDKSFVDHLAQIDPKLTFLGSNFHKKWPTPNKLLCKTPIATAGELVS